MNTQTSINKSERIYLGTWFPRTSLHLREIYNFLKSGQVIAGLGVDKAKGYHKKLGIKSVRFHEKPIIDFIEVYLEEITMTITEDGVVLISMLAKEPQQAITVLEEFYTKKLSPALAFLFSKGAPLPKELANVKNVFPHLFVKHGISQDEVDEIFLKLRETKVSSVSSENVEITFGNAIAILNLSKESEMLSIEVVEELLRNIVFFREFEQQLNAYLNLHRIIWDEIARIREADNLRYRDFSEIRQKIMGFLKTLAFVEARLLQMGDAISVRRQLIGEQIKKMLDDLSLNKFEHLDASQSYISHLWQMTTEYADGSLKLMESLYEENAQRELNALKFITFIGALTGFFGMNIAFPWEERWPSTIASSVIVVIAIIAVCFGFYFILKHLIYNRRFSLAKK